MHVNLTFSLNWPTLQFQLEQIRFQDSIETSVILTDFMLGKKRSSRRVQSVVECRGEDFNSAPYKVYRSDAL